MVGADVLGGDPGGQDVVGMVGEVIADQCVEQVVVAVEVGRCHRDELAIPGRDGAECCAGQQFVAARR